MKTKTRHIRVGISAKQTEGDEFYKSEPNFMSVICDAVITESDSRISIEYDERLSGDEAVTKTTLFFDKNASETVSMFRLGDVSVSCSFSQGERCACFYKTGELSLDFFIVTKSVKNSLTFSGGGISLCYNMEVKGITISRNEYKLHVIDAK